MLQSIALLVYLSMAIHASPPTYQDTLREMVRLIETAPSDEASYAWPELSADIGTVYFGGLGAQATPRPNSDGRWTTLWYPNTEMTNADRLLVNLSRTLTDLSEDHLRTPLTQLIELLRTAYAPIEARIHVQNKRTLHQTFLRETGSSFEDVSEELWREYRAGHISDTLVSRFAGGSPTVNDFDAREYLNKRIALAERTAGRVVGNFLFDHAMTRLAFGATFVRKAYPDQPGRIETYYRHAATIFARLLDREPPTFAGTYLQLLNGATLLLLRSAEDLPRQIPRTIALNRMVVERIHSLPVDPCELALKYDGVLHRVKDLDLPKPEGD